jgi:hypothetical protein
VAPHGRVGTRYPPGGFEQADAIFFGETGELGTVGDERFQELDGGPEAVFGHWARV